MNYIHAPIDTTPAPPLRPVPSFKATLAERLLRSPVAAKVMNSIITKHHRTQHHHANHS